jgi:hypothetical protein
MLIECAQRRTLRGDLLFGAENQEAGDDENDPRCRA